MSPPTDEDDEGEHLTHVDCDACRGTGYRCLSCGGKGVVETAYGRERREEAEEYRAEQREDENMREKWFSPHYTHDDEDWFFSPNDD